MRGLIPACTDSPTTPSQYPPSRVRLWLVAAWAGSAQADAQAGPKPGDVRVQRWPEMYVDDWTMKAQLKAWLNARAGREPSFREACRIRGWDRRSAMRGVDMALALISIGLDAEGAATR